MNFYIDNIDNESNELHLLYWNRDCKMEDLSCYKDIKMHEFLCYQEDEVSKIVKLKAFQKYRKYTKKVLCDNNFDLIIVMHSLPGVMILDELIKRYSNKYIFDYRDSTYERNPLFKKIIHTIVNNAKATFVSSDAFRKYLPTNASIYTSHNLLLDSMNHRDEKQKHGIPSDKIRIAFWGYIRHEEINKKIIERIASDDRFELHYYGREQETALNLKKYAHESGAKNVFFHGEYKPEDRYEFVRNTDIIHNIYCDNNMMLAMSNKYYDGIIFRIPQLCINGSYMGERAVRAGIGFICSPYDEDFADRVYRYYLNIDASSFNQNCDDELNRVVQEYMEGAKIINQL